MTSIVLQGRPVKPQNPGFSNAKHISMCAECENRGGIIAWNKLYCVQALMFHNMYCLISVGDVKQQPDF